MGEDRGICWFRVSIHGSVSKLESFVMRNEYLDKVEDNASNNFQELRGIWAQWDDEAKQLFYQNYGDLPHLLDIKVDKCLFRAMVQFWNPAYSCFTFGEVDLVPTLEEYTTLLRCPKIQGNKAYVRPANLLTFVKKLMMITGMSEQWAAARIQQKCDGKCISWSSLRDLILTHPDLKRRVDVLALSIYGLVIFPKAMGHIDEAVADLVDRLGKQNTPVPAILAETFRSLNACRRVREDYSSLKEAAATPRRDDITEESFDWVPLPGIWGVVSYTHLLVVRQYKVEQFIPATQGLAQSDFSYKGDHYKTKMREIFEAWKKVCCMKILTKGPTTTSEYKGWFGKRVNDNIPRPSLEAAQSMEENLRVIPSELEVIKQEFERKNLKLGRKIERLEEEKMYLSLDVDVQKIEVKKNNGNKRFKKKEPKPSTRRRSSKRCKHRIRLETALQNCELRIEQLEAREGHWKEELYHLQDQVGDRDYLIGEAIVQIREVADHLQDLAAQANVLSTKYELVTDRGLELASLLDKIKTLGLRAKAYL
ncbi:hypothetical protein CXB51_034086 [Gossypium anomalum]|uniref:DUF7745 domain-containing protein n=1 Tax=Gossypium anomalum TaxID=47600 RepID=A0A8J6CGJ3_9ROSI|nr:hypothetical protein CXB51_034086 [Gossypium anomalum]